MAMRKETSTTLIFLVAVVGVVIGIKLFAGRHADAPAYFDTSMSLQDAVAASEFVFTHDAAQALRILRRSFAKETGEGFFLIGSYGAGKSHLLATGARSARGSGTRGSGDRLDR